MRLDVYIHDGDRHRCCCHHTRTMCLGTTTIHVVEVGPLLKEEQMPHETDHMPPFLLHSANNFAVLAVVGAKHADGTYVPGTDVTWATNDLTNPLVPVADDVVRDADGNPVLDANGNQIPVFRIQVNTPGDNGDVLVTWSAAQMASADIHVQWSTPPEGHVTITPSELPETP